MQPDHKRERANVARLEAEIRDALGEPRLIARDSRLEGEDARPLVLPGAGIDLPQLWAEPKADRWHLAIAAADTTNFYGDDLRSQRSDANGLVVLLNSGTVVRSQLRDLRDLLARHQLKPKGVTRLNKAQRDDAALTHAEALRVLATLPSERSSRALAEILTEYDLAKPQSGRQYPTYYSSPAEHQLDEAEAVFRILRAFWETLPRDAAVVRGVKARRYVYKGHHAEYAGHRFVLTDRNSVLEAAATIADLRDPETLELRLGGRRGASNGWRRSKRAAPADL